VATSSAEVQDYKLSVIQQSHASLADFAKEVYGDTLD
jgi:hypothetical protein